MKTQDDVYEEQARNLLKAARLSYKEAVKWAALVEGSKRRFQVLASMDPMMASVVIEQEG